MNWIWNQKRLAAFIQGFEHNEIDMRDRTGVLSLVQSIKPDAIVHAAAQPSHDKAAEIPFEDFDINTSEGSLLPENEVALNQHDNDIPLDGDRISRLPISKLLVPLNVAAVPM